MDGTVLLADDDRTIRTVLTQALTRAGCRVHATSSLVTLMRWVEEGRGDIVISDVIMPDGNGLDQLPQIAQRRPSLPVIVISAQNTIMTAIQATEAEAFDYLPKPFDLPDLMKRVSHGISQRRRKGAMPAAIVRSDLPDDMPLVGKTPVMQDLYRRMSKVMNTSLPVLIQGESGTGKSLIARTLHELSDRRTQPFVIASADDLETEDRAAQIHAKAASGTLVVDGVETLNHTAQARLMAIMDASADDAPCIISIASPDIETALADGRLKPELFYRMGGVTLSVPALRDRIDDISLLARHFLMDATDDPDISIEIGPDAEDALRRYHWPGNIRQLAAVVRQLCLLAKPPVITADDVRRILETQPYRPKNVEVDAGDRLSDAVAVHVQRYFDLHGDDLPAPGVYSRILREFEIPLLEIALDATGGNQAKCADLLGINRNTLRKKLTTLDIHVTRRRKLM